MAKTQFSRREMLRYAGAAGALCLPLLEQRRARAAVDPRFLGVYFPNGAPGNPKDVFLPVTGANGRDWSGLSTEALAPWDDQLITFEHLALNKGVGVDPDLIGGCRPEECVLMGQHTDGCSALFTGSELVVERDNHTSAGGPSVDEQILQASGGRRLNVGVKTTSKAEYRISWAEARRANHPETSARSAYESILPSLMENCAGADVGAARDPNLERILRERRFVMDALQPELQSAKRIFGLDAEERQKLELYETSLAELGKTLEVSEPTGAGTVDCGALDVDGLSDSSELQTGISLHTDVMALAFALRAVNVGMLQMGAPYSDLDFSFLDGVTKTSYHKIQHGSRAEQAETVFIMRWHTELFANVLAKLDSYQEGDGTVLDNSVIMWGSDVPNGFNHMMPEPHCTLVAGGGAGRLNPGAHVTGEHYHINLLSTLCNAMGVDGAPFQAENLGYTGELETMLR